MGLRSATLDDEFVKRRETEAKDRASSVVDEITKWKESVDGDALLSDVQELISRFVILPSGASIALAL